MNTIKCIFELLFSLALLLCLPDNCISPWNTFLTHHQKPMLCHSYCVLHAVHIQFFDREFSITFRCIRWTAAFSLQNSPVVLNVTFPCSFAVLTFNVIFRHAPSSSRSIPLPSSFSRWHFGTNCTRWWWTYPVCSFLTVFPGVLTWHCNYVRETNIYACLN